MPVCLSARLAVQSLLLALACASLGAQASDIPESKDQHLSHLLAFSKTIASRSVQEVYEIKLIVESFYGDCSNPGPKCPTQRLYVSVVEGGIQPRLFVVGLASSWSFVRWIDFPSSLPGTDEPVRFELKKQFVRGKTFATTLQRFRLDPAGLAVEQ